MELNVTDPEGVRITEVKKKMTLSTEKLIKALRACAEHTNCRECPALGWNENGVACYDNIVLQAADEIQYWKEMADGFAEGYFNAARTEGIPD